MKEGYNGEILDGRDLLDLLAVLGEDSVRMYLVSISEGEQDAA